MIKKFGKPIDVARFKKSMIDPEKLKALISRNDQFGKFVAGSPRSEKVLKCPVCRSQEREQGPVIYSIRYDICSACGMYYAALRLGHEDLKKYYSQDSDYSKTSYADKETYHYRAQEVSSPKIDFVSDFIGTSRKKWLDVGSGIGDVVYNLKSRGFDVKGLELSEESVRFSKDVFGVDLEKKDIADVLKQEGKGSFDVVSYFGVLEHMTDPLRQVECARELLAPGGLFVMEVPNAQSFSVAGDSFFRDSVVRQMTPFLHIMLFSQRSLMALAERFSFYPEGMWFIGLDFYNLILHIGTHVPGFLKSDVCGKCLELNNEIQSVFDKREMSDQILFVCRKK